MDEMVYRRFSYQFAGRKFLISHGWLNLFQRLCHDIDEALGPDKRGFRWTEIRQKYGGLRLYYELPRGDEAVARQVDKLVELAELQSEKTCEVCGATGEIEHQDFWLDCLCPHHRQKRGTMKTAEWREVLKYDKLYGP